MIGGADNPTAVFFILSTVACLITLLVNRRGYTKLENTDNEIAEYKDYIQEYNKLLRKYRKLTAILLSCTFGIAIIIFIDLWVQSIEATGWGGLGLGIFAVIILPMFSFAAIFPLIVMLQVTRGNAVAKLNHKYLTRSGIAIVGQQSLKISNIVRVLLVIIFWISLIYGIYFRIFFFAYF